VLPLVLSSSALPSGAKGREERDLLFARLFGLHALVVSDALFQPSSTLRDFETVIQEALYLGERKTWLRESAGWLVQTAARRLLSQTTESLEWKDEAVNALVTSALDREKSVKEDTATKKAPQANEFWTPEKLALAVLLQNSNSVRLFLPCVLV